MTPDNIPPPPPGWAIVPADDRRLACLPCKPMFYSGQTKGWYFSHKGKYGKVRGSNVTYALPIDLPVSQQAESVAEADKLAVGGSPAPVTPGLDPKGEAGKAKAPLYLLPPEALRQASWAHSLGAKKYGPANWRSNKVKASTYISAMMRHLAAYLDGEDHDAETSAHAGQPVSHLANVIASANILIDAKKNGTLEDDRPPRRPELSPLCPD